MDTPAVRLSVLSNDNQIGPNLCAECPHGHDVLIQSSTDSAEIEATAYRPTDVVIIDLDVAGDLEVVRRIATRPNAPVVAVLIGRGLAGQTIERTVIQAELRGASVVFPKPVAADELAAANASALARRIA